MRQTWLYSLILPLIVVVLFFPILFQEKTLLPTDQLNTMFLPYSAHHDSVRAYNHFLTDAIAQVYPYKVRLRAAWLRGEFASWNPSLYGGHPHYASTSFTPFDATNVILLLGDMPSAYHWQMLAKLLIAGVAMWFLLGFFTVQGVRIHAALRVLFAMAYMLNSLFITTLQHQWVLGVFCWMPLAILFLLKYFAEKHRSAAVWSGVFLALGFLGGSLQTNAIAVMLFVIVGIFAALANNSKNTSGERIESSVAVIIRSGSVMLAIGCFAFILTAFMWLPSLELFLYNFNVRAGGKPFSLVDGIKSIPLLFTFAMPELLGTVRGFDLAKIAHADMNDFTAFIGFAPMFFALLGVIHFWRKMPEMRAFIVLVGVGVCMPLFTPLYKFLYHRSFIVYVFGMCVLGAVAAQEILFGKGELISEKSLKQALQLALVLLVCVGFALLLGTGMLQWKYELIAQKLRLYVEKNMATSQLAGGSRSWMLGRAEIFLTHFSLLKNPALAFAVIVPFLTVVALRKHVQSAPEQRRTMIVISVMILATAFQLVNFAQSWLPMIDTRDYPLYPATQTTRYLQRDSSLFRIVPLFDAASQRVMQPNMNDMHGISCSEGYESVFPQNVSRLSGALEPPIASETLMRAGLINVKYYVASKNNRLEHPGLELVDSSECRVYRNAYWQNRAYMRYSYTVLAENERGKILAQPSDDAYLKAFTKESGFTEKTLLLFREPSEAIQRPDSEQIRHSVRFLNVENNRVRLQVETEQKGYCVLADTYYAGWRAYVNGTERPIMRANYALRAVVVPSGTSIVEFRFEPPLFALGWKLSIGGMLLGFVLIGADMVRRRR